MKSTGDAAHTDTEAEGSVVKTFGEIFPDGSLMEVVASATGDQPNLLLFDGKSTFIARQIEHGGRIFQVQELPASAGSGMAP